MFTNKPAFGAASSSGFGFGTNTPTNANPFGQNQTQSLFGKPATGFGAPSTSFGQPQNTTLFSQPQQQPSLFNNANNSFGAAPTTQSGFGGGLFGQQPSTSGLFNSPSTFGQQNKPTGFGFGTQQTQPVMFGHQAQTPGTSNLFQPQQSSLFGSTTPGFGGQQQQNGTTIKFNPVTGTDTMVKNGQTQTINTKHHSITCMKEYETKSFEELRFEDYQVNRKGPQQSSGFGAAPFGAPASSAPGLFGQQDQNKTAFGQTSSVFGQGTSTFGQPTSSGFGMGTQQTNMGSNLFGKPTGFGTLTSTAQTSGFGGFGTTTPSANPFGGAQQNKPFGTAPVFGTPTSQPSTGFGTTTGGLFGTQQPQNQSTGIFGKPAQPTTGFGTMGQPGFGITQPTASTQSSTLFNTTNKPLFGQPTTSTGGFGLGTFGQTNNSTFSNLGKPAFGATLGVPNTGFGTSFGTNQQTTGLFGQTKTDGGIFGSNNSTGLFGTNNTTFQANTGFTLGANAPNDSLFPQNQATANGANLAMLTSDPFGDAPHLAGLEPKAKTADNSIATNPTELKSLLDTSKKVDMSHSPRLKVFPKGRKDSLFDGIQKQETEAQDYLKKSVRRLVIKPKQHENPNLLRDEIFSNIEETLDNSIVVTPNVTPLKLNFDTTLHDEETKIVDKSAVQEGGSDEENRDPLAAGDSNKQKRHPTGIVCTRPEYYIKPDLDELAQYVDENGNCFVKGFTIGRLGYGNVCFPDEMDVANLNIDQLVQFRYREINVYPDESKKPPVGQGLNRRAQVTLDKIYPKRSGTNILIEDVNELVQMNFAEKLRKVTVKKNAKFVDYRPETGSWVFKVDHFSKYGYNDSDEEMEVEDKAKKLSLNLKNVEVMKRIPDEDLPKDGTKYGLEGDIFDDDEDDEQSNEDDLLQQSMLVDMHEDNYHQIPDLIPFDSYKSTKNIQLMKSTLFGDDDRSSEASSHVSIIRQYLDIPEEIPQFLPPIREQITRRAVLRPKVVKIYNYTAAPSTLPSKTYMDMAIFKAKSFKCGWSKGFSFDKLNNTEVIMSSLRPNKDFDPLKECLIDSLKIVLQESTCDVNAQQIPTFKILKGNAFLLNQTKVFENLALKYNTAETQYLHSIWTLCVALWGPGEETAYMRRHLLSEWLKNNTDHSADYNKSVAMLPPHEKASAIFNLLSVFKVFDAANLSMENQFPQLSLIISQLSLTNKTKGFLQEQIEGWYNTLAANHISPEIKRIYLLLSGIPSKEDVNVFEDIDWKRAFAMHLWYIVPNGVPIEVAIEMYKNSFDEIGYAERPLPPYCTNYTEDNSFDVLYHILQLYKSPIHRLSDTLNPATHTNDPLDYRLSWLLLQLFLSLERGLLDIPEKIKICTSFANQLEDLGKWEWAIFVLLYMEDNHTKKKLVMDILGRNLSPETDKTALDVQNNLVNNMKIPPTWIHLVKGEKTRALGRYFEAFNHFAKALEYGEANEIFIEHILPGLFINEQFDLIRMLIEELKPGAKTILKWNHQAGLINEFLDLQDKTITFREDEIFKLQTKLNAICERLGFFPTKTDQQKLCIAEMSKRCSWIYKELAKKSGTPILVSSFRYFIDALVMPPDFKRNEALCLMNDFDNFKLIKS